MIISLKISLKTHNYIVSWQRLGEMYIIFYRMLNDIWLLIFCTNVVIENLWYDDVRRFCSSSRGSTKSDVNCKSIRVSCVLCHNAYRSFVELSLLCITREKLSPFDPRIHLLLFSPILLNETNALNVAIYARSTVQGIHLLTDLFYCKDTHE